MANDWDFSGIDTGTPTDATRREPEGWSESAYKTQEANLSRKSQGGGGGSSFDLGGLFSSIFGGRQAKKIAEENRRWQEEQNKLAYERSLPWNVSGPAGDVEFDPETKQMLQTLSPEYQALMLGFIGSSTLATQELQSMMGDPDKLAKSQFDLLQEFSADDYAQSRMQGEEAALARGMIGTESYYAKKAIEDSINKSILADKIASIGLGMDYRQMLGAETLAQSEGARNIVGMLQGDATLGINVPKYTTVDANMQGIREGGQDYADTRSAFWSGMQDQKAKYNTQGNVTQEAQTGWLSQLLSGGKQFYSALTDNTRKSDIA